MKINGTGCSLVDLLYSPVDFNSAEYKKWSTESGTANGLITGGLTFGDDLEKTSGTPWAEILSQITGGSLTPSKNIGGPAVVAMINMSQLIDTEKHSLYFYGSRSDDENGIYLAEKLALFDIDSAGYLVTEGGTPFTDVLSDPGYNGGNGERTFINYIGAAGRITASELPDNFFKADMLIFGGTALTPRIHDNLSLLLKKGREFGCINCVNTVYDFRNQKKSPDKPWPLVENNTDFKNIDLLIMDNEEALRISGKNTKAEALDWFESQGVHSAVITHGSEPVICFSDGSLFHETGKFSMPVSEKAGSAMKSADADSADTTGCGDNFAGGVYASVIAQLSEATSAKPSLRRAAALGAVSGGFAGLYKGGVFYEEFAGHKRQLMRPFSKAYEKQTGINV